MKKIKKLSIFYRCGPDSPIPGVMANDALVAGVDTTGTKQFF
jgi:hypothetical protein